ncbi:hypothetical protein GCM10009751_36480 [Myceligenerans crystallogenes]|uniref:Uncharacterized protein n=1 Tax=Myceligenerans crystallogenes TaxID=316335 RepID=A0ABN2NKW6_9MICO
MSGRTAIVKRVAGAWMSDDVAVVVSASAEAGVVVPAATAAAAGTVAAARSRERRETLRSTVPPWRGPKTGG